MLNVTEITYSIFFVFMIGLAVLIKLMEAQLPPLVSKLIRFGKFASQRECDYSDRFEVPKETFKYFYSFGLFWASCALYLVIDSYIGGQAVPETVIKRMNIFVGSQRTVNVDEISTFVAIVLIFLQISRRFYETNFIQIFSKSSKINFLFCGLSFLHYFILVWVMLAYSPGFVANSRFSLISLRQLISVRVIIGSSVFLYAWYQQFLHNLIFINLRKNKSGQVVTEKHLMPRGGYFELVSAPHMLFEIVMYIALAGILSGNRSFLFVLMFVIGNQVMVGGFNHRWYIDTFPNYPTDRKAIIPYIF